MTTLRGRRFGAFAASAVVITAVAMFVTPGVQAQSEGMISIPLDTVVRAAPGELVVLDEVAVPDQFVGADCRIESRAENNSSVHPGNDLIVTSDGLSVVLSDVEAAPGKVTTADGRLSLGPTARLTLRMGPDGIFSGGATALVVIQCFPPETTTTTTTTTVPASTGSTSTTTTTTILGPSTSLDTTTTMPVTTTTVVEVIDRAPPAQVQEAPPAYTG